MHYWGDKGVDWEGIFLSALEIGEFLSKWSNIEVTDMKEKYGEARVYCSCPSNIYDRFIYKMAYRTAINKRPHLKEEILEGADWPEFLEHLR